MSAINGQQGEEREMGKHSKPTNPTIRRLVAASVIVPAGLGLATAFAAPAWADAPDGKGNTSAEDSDGTKSDSTGKPDNPNGFGAVSSQLATAVGGLGEHTSSFAPGQHNTDGGGATGRLGVGNVASNDGNLVTDALNDPDRGTRPGDHASLIDGFTPERSLPDTINAFGHPGRLCTTCR
jgi:hypothetical protein